MTDARPKPAASAAPCATHASTPDPDPSDLSEADTGRHSAPALLSRIAGLHRMLADAVEDLAKVAQIKLAARPDLSVMGGDMPMSESTGPGKLLSVSDLAGIFQVNDKTIRTWRDEQRLPEPVQIGGVIRWHAGVLDEWLRGCAR